MNSVLDRFDKIQADILENSKKTNIPIEIIAVSKTFPLEKIKPLIGGKPTLLLLIDNLRFDQWKTIESLIYPLFETHDESHYLSILPTTTQYSRNSIFSGLTPYEMSKKFPYWWINDEVLV